MALIVPLGELTPRLGRDVFVAPNATLIGDVELGDEASVWFGSVLRGDIGPIRIGARTNVQDLSCVHLTDGVSSTRVGADVTIGHGAILHGCIVGDGCLIGMGSILLDNCEIGAGSLVAAGTLVPPRMKIPPRSLVRGSPAKVVREVSEEEGRMGPDGASHYVANARRFLALGLPGDRGERAVKLTVNGEPREVAAGLTVHDLVEELGLHDGPVAVERNGEVVPRAEHPGTALAEGDVIEIVHFVGGG